MKKFLFPAVLTTTLFGVFACNNDEVIDNIVPEDQKGLISFSASAVTGSASASQPQTRAGFAGQTKIVARISSKNGSSVRHTRTVLTAALDAAANGGAYWPSYSTVSYADGNNRYWDDAFGRSANLSVYAVAVPEKTDVTNNGTNLFNLVPCGSSNVANATNWQTDDETELNKISWQVSTSQSSDAIANEDLCYSHNIQADKDADGDLKYGKGKDGVRKWNGTEWPEYSYTESGPDHYPTLDDGCMKFTLDTGQPADGTGRFDKGHMIFHHALTRMTVKLVKGTGFGDFTPNNITLLNMHYKGKFDFKNGTWSAYTAGGHADNGNITMALQSGNTFMAQFVPGYELGKTSKTNVMQFTISGNTYYITQDMLYSALTDPATNNTTTKDHNGNFLVDNTGDKVVLEQGKNYVFSITVKKQQIESITASLEPWIKVTASTDVKNDYVKIGIQDATGDHCTYFDLYRLSDNPENIYAPESGTGTGTDWEKRYNWNGNYTKEGANKQWDSGKNLWKTDWFWESNKAFYHFRTVNENLTITAGSGGEKKDYFNIFGGPIQDYAQASRTTIQAKAYSELTETEKNKNYNDYHWGAPFKKPTGGKKIVYDKDYGWSAAQDADKQIYPAIGSTSDQINIIEHHMMSNVRFILKTTHNDAAADKLGAGAVNLDDAEVTITRIYNQGKVYMGTGKVETVTDGDTELIKTIKPAQMFPNAEDKTVTNAYTYRVVPQTLFRGSNKNTDDLDYFVGLTIKTKDDNQYYVIKKLTTVTASTVKQNDSNYAGGEQKQGEAIEFWYPGHDYTYTITISKKGIEAITCSIVPWITVTGSNIDIDLEK